MSSIYHHIKHKILVIGSAGCGKTSLIESILSRSKSDYECHPSSPGIDIKQCHYSQSHKFHEVEIELKIFERTVDGPLDRKTMQPFYCQLDTIIGVYDLDNFETSFPKMRSALDSILALYEGKNENQLPTIYVLGTVRDHRQCRSHGPYREVKEYVDRIGAIQLYNYCYSSRHIKAFHHVMMLNVYRRHFRSQLNNAFQQAVENCRRHVYMDNYLDEQSDQQQKSSAIANLKNLRHFFQKLKFPHHHHHHHHPNHHHNEHNAGHNVYNNHFHKQAIVQHN